MVGVHQAPPVVYNVAVDLPKASLDGISDGKPLAGLVDKEAVMDGAERVKYIHGMAVGVAKDGGLLSRVVAAHTPVQPALGLLQHASCVSTTLAHVLGHALLDAGRERNEFFRARCTYQRIVVVILKVLGMRGL